MSKTIEQFEKLIEEVTNQAIAIGEYPKGHPCYGDALAAHAIARNDLWEAIRCLLEEKKGEAKWSMKHP